MKKFAIAFLFNFLLLVYSLSAFVRSLSNEQANWKVIASFSGFFVFLVLSVMLLWKGKKWYEVC